jgi:predicted nucleic acid-binding protein
MLVDTNVLSELARPEPDAAVRRWAAEVRLPIRISAITLEEVRFGLAWRPSRRVQIWFEHFLAEECEVLPVTAEIARRAGELRGRFRAAGQQRTQADMLIAATAQAFQLSLVTRNLRDFEGCGVPLLDPWQTALDPPA